MLSTAGFCGLGRHKHEPMIIRNCLHRLARRINIRDTNTAGQAEVVGHFVVPV
jgi:hypothetical protein